MLPEPPGRTSSDALVTWTNVIYLLHAFSLLTGILGAATVIGAFLIGWPSIIAVILNYLKRSDVRGTWLESHFRWQIHTFWYGLLWATLCLLLCSAWLLPWYVVWVLPFAAVGNSPRLRAATLVFTCYVIASRVPSSFG